MALQTILKNICSFLKILDASRSSKVALWDAMSLHNAFEWAAYCQQIYIQSKGKPYSKDLDLEIRKMGELLQKTREFSDSSFPEIGLGMLEHSSSVLITSLLANAHLKQETLAVLISDAMPDQTATHLISECSRLIQLKATFQLVAVISKDLFQRSANGSSAGDFDSLFQLRTKDLSGCSSSVRELQSCDPLTLLCLTQLLLCFLTNALQEDAHMSDINRVQLMLMEKFSHTELGQVCLMTSFLKLKSCGVRSVNSCVKNVLGECLKLLVNQSDASFLSSPLLISVCNQSFEFYGHYVRHLVKCCENLKPVYGTYPVSHPHQLVTWRPCTAAVSCSKVPVYLEYDNVKRCFASLLSSVSSQVVSATVRLLQSLAKHQEPSAIWTTLRKDLQLVNVDHS